MTIQTNLSRLLRCSAAAALLALPLGGAALAQDQSTQGSSEQPQQEQSGTGGQSGQQGGDGQGMAGDQLVVTVGDAEIRNADVLTAIGMLPEPLQAQQPDMLVPIALDQLITRELILQRARSENLSEDPEVQTLVEQSSAAAEEDAMVQVWLRRELQDAVSDQAVQQTYDQLAQNTQSEVPALEQLRPQIEQHLRQQAFGQIRQNLAQDVAVVFYDPSGQPIRQEGGQPQVEEGSDSGTDEGSESGDTSGSGN